MNPKFTNRYDDNPQFNIALLGKFVCLSCNKKMLSDVRDIIATDEEISKDFTNFLDDVARMMAGEGTTAETEEYQIARFDGVFTIHMTQEFAKDISYSLQDILRGKTSDHPRANVVFALSKRLNLAAEGDFKALQTTASGKQGFGGRPMPPMPYPMFGYYPPQPRGGRFSYGQ